jgi:hypothetical protein
MDGWTDNNCERIESKQVDKSDELKMKMKNELKKFRYQKKKEK